MDQMLNIESKLFCNFSVYSSVGLPSSKQEQILNILLGCRLWSWLGKGIIEESPAGSAIIKRGLGTG